MRKLLTVAAVAMFIGVGAPDARAAEEGEVPSRSFSFDGVFGTFDRAAAQRGLQVYNQVCSACHSLELVAFRNLSALGYDDEQVEAIAAQYTVEDGPDDRGEMYEREARPEDRFPSPYPNEQAARATHQGAYPPDLSLITKARERGPEYLHALLTGYTDPPEGAEVPSGQYWNTAYPGHQIAMAPPLMDGIVDYADGTEATVDQMAHDVATFLHWAAEPHMEERKRMGIGIVLFLVIFTGLLYAAKRKVWRDMH